MSEKKRKLRATEGKPAEVDESFQKVMKDLAGIESPKSPKKSPKGERPTSPGSPGLAATLSAKKAARQLRGFRTTFGSKKNEEAQDAITETERALLEAKLEAEREEKNKEEEERLRKEAEEKDLAERKQVKESLDKWKVKKTDTVLLLAGKNFLPEEIEIIGRALVYTDTYMWESLVLSRQSFVKCDEIKLILEIGNVRDNFTLKSIEMITTKIGDEGCKWLQHCLAENGTVTKLDLRDSGEVTEEGARRFLSLVKVPEKPKEILPMPYYEILGNTPEGVKVIENLPPDWSSVYDDVLLPAVTDNGPRLLTVRIVEAKDLIACDSSGKSDPYVKILFVDSKTKDALSEQFKTKTVKKTLEPKFDETFVFGKKVSLAEVESQPTLRLTIFDSDTFSSEEMGKIEIPLPSIDQSTTMTSKWFPLEKSEKMKKDVTGQVLIELQYSKEGKTISRGVRNSSSRMFKRSIGKIRTSFKLRSTSPTPKRSPKPSAEKVTTPKSRSTSPFRRSVGKKSWMGAKSALSLIAGPKKSGDNDVDDVDVDLLASNLAETLAAQVQMGEEQFEKKKAAAKNATEDQNDKSAPSSPRTEVTPQRSERGNLQTPTSSASTPNLANSPPSSSLRNIFGVRSFGKRALQKMKSRKNEKMTAQKSSVEGDGEGGEEKKSDPQREDFPGIEDQESSLPQLSDVREAGLVNAFAANLGMSGEVKTIIKQRNQERKKHEDENSERLGTPKSVLKHSKSTHSSTTKAIMEDEDTTRNEGLSLTLLEASLPSATQSPSPPKSAVKSPVSALKSPAPKSALKSARFSGKGKSVDLSSSSSTSERSRPRGDSKIKFSASSTPGGLAIDVGEENGGDDAEKVAEEMAAKLAAMVVDVDQDSTEGGETPKSKKSGFASFGGLGKAARSFKKSVGKLSPKNAGSSSSPSRSKGMKTWSAARKKLNNAGSFQASKSPLVASHKHHDRKTAGVIGLAGSTKTETIDDLIAESVGPTPEPEPDYIVNQTKPLCPSIIELNGLPVKLLLGGKLTTLNLESMKLGNVEAHLLAELLKSCEALTSLNLHKNKFKVEAMSIMAPTIEGLTELKHLDLSSNLLFKTGGMLVARILAKCENLESLILASCELTNSKEISLNERKVKEDKDDIIPDQLAAMMLRDEMGRHKKIIHLDVEENEIDDFIMLGVKNRLKVNKALLHGRPEFEAFVDSKFNLKGNQLEREKLEHTTNISVDHGYFDRERVERVAYAVVEGEGTVERKEREAKEERERILKLEEEERKKQEERMKEQLELEELGMAAAPGEEVGGGGSEDSAVNLLVASKILKKVHTRSSLYGKKKKKKKKDLWDDTPHLYYLNRVPFREEVKPGTPHSRHAFRKNFVYPPPERCGACIGCSALLRCENQGAYTRTAETVDLIRTGLLDGEMDLKEALAIVRDKAVDKTNVEKKRYTRRGSDLKRRPSKLGKI
ncbi:hypothetical protein TrST_g3840 [Triparma strigata]|uniref:C2 domain-containing protein n=1 Tax=Triparma strigata TaxID=1606541 RepID=A0A9W7EV95_9STRA|nr:hypothetical protein TrST_g3840 [Triparma strigata]